MDQAHPTRARGAEAAGKDSLPRTDSPPRHADFRRADPVHLNALPAHRPARKSAQVRWLWPEIAKRSRPATRSATSGGNWLSTDLRSHIRTSAPMSLVCENPTRTSRPSTASDASSPPPTDVQAGAPPAVPPTNRAARAAELASYDPLANLRDRLTHRPGFRYDDRPPDEKKLI